MVKNDTGAIIFYNETVKVSQLVITVPDPCHHFEATVTAQCGTAIGAASRVNLLGGKF